MLKAQHENSYNLVMLIIYPINHFIGLYLFQCYFQETCWDQQIKRFKSKKNKTKTCKNFEDQVLNNIENNFLSSKAKYTRYNCQ